MRPTEDHTLIALITALGLNGKCGDQTPHRAFLGGLDMDLSALRYLLADVDAEEAEAILHGIERMRDRLRAFLHVEQEIEAYGREFYSPQARRVTPLPNLGEDPDDSQPVTFTDAQVHHLRGLLDVAHDRVFRRRNEPRSDASPVEALLEGALYRAAGATVQKLPDEKGPSIVGTPGDPDDDAARELVRFTTEQLLNQLHGRIQVLEGIAEGRGWDDETFLLALRGCFGRSPKKSEAAE